ncbi:MAG: M67 family metallopeptidase [Deferribacteraceae bacterium]|jgi:proteasome lid subunit RPN8/RPN11|nr:M67 family metallopeptidase [Deferribacteraceae bacterium]
MLKITEEVYNTLIEHVKKEYPNEACGFLAGEEAGLATVIFPMRNIDESPIHFTMEPKEQFNVLREAIKRGVKLTVCYHSHPATPARPSQEDLLELTDPKLSYIIVSLANKEAKLKSFKIKGGAAEEEEIEVIR